MAQCYDNPVGGDDNLYQTVTVEANCYYYLTFGVVYVNAALVGFNIIAYGGGTFRPYDNSTSFGTTTLIGT